MFHYTNLEPGGVKRRSADIAVGDQVRSRYRNPWYGVVVALHPDGGCADVRQVLNKRGGVIRKGRVARLHVNWLAKTSFPGYHDARTGVIIERIER